jgi:hypothetical protein
MNKPHRERDSSAHAGDASRWRSPISNQTVEPSFVAEHSAASNARARWPGFVAAAISLLAIALVFLWVIMARPGESKPMATERPQAEHNPLEAPARDSDAGSSLVAFPRLANEISSGTASEAEGAAVTGSSSSVKMQDPTPPLITTVEPAETTDDGHSLPGRDATPDPATLSVTVTSNTEPASTVDPAQDVVFPKRPRVPAPNEPEYLAPEPTRGRDPTYAGTEPAGSDKLETFAKEVRELLEFGWNVKQSGIDRAQQRFRAANELCPTDPRAAYALGLVLLKHNKYDDALKQFDSVGTAAMQPYLPALRAAVWLRVLRKSYEPATSHMIDLARALGQAEPEPLPNWVASELAIWSGRVVGYLEGPADSRNADALTEKCALEMREILSADHWELFMSARRDVLDEYAAKATAQERARMEAKRQQELAADKTKARLAVEAADAKQEKQEVEKNADDLERKLKEQLSGIDFQINSLLRDQERINTRIGYIANAVRLLDLELADLSAQRAQLLADSETQATGTAGTPKAAQNLATVDARLFAITAAIDLRARERLRYQFELDRLDVQLREIQRQGTWLVNRRQSLIHDYQTTSGKLYKERESIVAKERFLERKKHEADKPATGSTTQVKALGQTAKAFRTYVDLNLDLEKQRLLSSFDEE